MMTNRIMERSVPERTVWEATARGLFRAEMAKKGITYAQLFGMLEFVGVREDERNLRNKVSRGKFTAPFMLQCLTAIGCHTVHLGDV